MTTRNSLLLFTQIVLMCSLSTKGFCSPKTLSVTSFKSVWSGEAKQSTESDYVYTRITTAPQEGPSYFAAKLQTPISFEDRFVRTKVRINSLGAVGGIELRLSSDESGSFENHYAISIPLYADPDFNILQPNEWAEITLSLGEARIIGSPDIRSIHHIAFYIGGKPAPEEVLTVDFQSVVAEESIPTSILSMTFDDGYTDHYEAAKIMARYGLRGTAYVMINEIGHTGHLTQEQLFSLKDDYSWSISSHHSVPITDPRMDLAGEIDKTFDYLNKYNLGPAASHFAYPLGKQSRSTTLPFIRQHFDTARIASGGAETLPPSDWHMLKTYNVTPDKTPQEIAERIATAQKHNEWLILMFHFFSEGTPEGELTYQYEKFEELCKLISESGIRVHPVNEVHEALVWK